MYCNVLFKINRCYNQLNLCSNEKLIKMHFPAAVKTLYIVLISIFQYLIKISFSLVKHIV